MIIAYTKTADRLQWKVKLFINNRNITQGIADILNLPMKGKSIVLPRMPCIIERRIHRPLEKYHEAKIEMIELK